MQNITLIGMSGVGKSTVGKLFAMGTRQFFDTDTLIERRFGNEPIRDILARLGPEAFLQVEREVILEHRWPEHLPYLVATGGSVVYIDEAMEFLRSVSTVVYLKIPFAILAARVSFEGRGIVSHHGGSFEDVFREREPLYEKWAHVTVNAHDSPIGVALGITRAMGSGS